MPAAGSRTVRSCDLASVLYGAFGGPDLRAERGYVVGSGTHEDLLAAGATYAGLFTVQAFRTSSASPYVRLA